MSEISPTLQALLEQQAETFMRDAAAQMFSLDPLAFYRWAADEQLANARVFANTARKERDAAPAAPATVEQLLAAQNANGNRNTCDCVHCAPHLRAIHGNGCSGYHCKGTCINTPLERCGRCGSPNRPNDISATGPYRTCPACTDIIRN